MGFRWLIGWGIGSDVGSIAAEGQVLGVVGGRWTGTYPSLYATTNVTVTQGAGTVVPLDEIVEVTITPLRDTTTLFDEVTHHLIEIYMTFDAATAGDAGDPLTLTFDDFAPAPDVPLTGRHAGTGFVVIAGIHIPVHALWDAPNVIVFERLDAPPELVGVDPSMGLIEGDVISVHLRHRDAVLAGS
jgi:hypothetical protein